MIPWDEQPSAFTAFSNGGSSINLKEGFGCQHHIKSWLAHPEPSGWPGAERGMWGDIPMVAGKGKAGVWGEGRSFSIDTLSACGTHLGSTWWCTWIWWHVNSTKCSHVPTQLRKILWRDAAKMSRIKSHILQGREDEVISAAQAPFWAHWENGQKPQTSQSNVDDCFWW